MSSKERPVIKLHQVSKDKKDAEPSGLKVYYETFAEAQQVKNELSDKFIDDAITGRLSVAGEPALFVKTYLDHVEPTDKDQEIISSPERIADLYKRTTEMLARNLKLTIVRSSDPVQAHARREKIRLSKQSFINNMSAEIPVVQTGIAEWCRGARKFPARAMEYHGFQIEGKDVLDAGASGSPDVRPNFKIQRQFAGSFIMAYSDARVHEKIRGREEILDKRIYLNPELGVVPELFEKLLHSANEAGLALQLKMYQRAPELASAYRKRANGEGMGGLRGDGIVIYVNRADADAVLGMALALARDNPSVFMGRETPKVPIKVADGIAIGDEPLQVKGESLTSHRASIIEQAVTLARRSGKIGAEAGDVFRAALRTIAQKEKVNSENLAFNT